MKNIKLITCLFLILLGVSSCRKEEALDVDFSNYNPDGYVATELDEWLSSTFTDEYNIEVLYRYNRYMTDVEKDVAPPKVEFVKPQMEAVLNGFLLPYKKIAGATFIRENTPKQFVLFGSGVYRDDGSLVLGTADGGRRVVLYEVNKFDPENPDVVKRRLRTIHHEFTHILNQLVRIPSEFEQINKADYVVSWMDYPSDEAKELGFISQYSRSAPGEDFAEMTAHLLVEGQLWFEHYLSGTNDEAKEKLREKEQIVVDYFDTHLNIDFRALQREMESVLTNTYDNGAAFTFAYWLNNGMYANLNIEVDEPHYSQYGFSSKFREVYDAFDQVVIDWSTARYSMDYLKFIFDSDTEMRVEFGFTAASGGTQFYARYNFEYHADPETGEVKFTKAEQVNEDGNYAYLFADGFETTLQAYLTENTFIADWIPGTLPYTERGTFGGFRVKGDPENYFYGPLEQNKVNN